MEISPKHTLYASKALQGGNLLLTPLLVTRDDATYEKACKAVKRIAAEAPRLRKATPGSARAIKIIKIEDYQAAANARSAGYLTRVPAGNESFASARICAEALGLSAKSLVQVLYMARRENMGTDASAVLHGLRFGYVEPSAKVSI